MNKITVVLKQGGTEVWLSDSWDDYMYMNGVFVITKNGMWVGIYNFDCIEKVVVE